MAVVAAALLWFLGMLPAAAHDQLIDSTPLSNDVLTDLPAQLSLEFSDEIIPMSPAVLIQNSANDTVFEATPDLNGRVATASFPELPDGTYRLNWSVVSADGHRIEGSIPFELATGIAPAVAGSPAASEPVSSMPESQAGTSSNTDATSPAESASTTTTGLASLPLAARVLLGLGALAAIATTLLLRSRRRRPNLPTPSEDS